MMAMVVMVMVGIVNFSIVINFCKNEEENLNELVISRASLKVWQVFCVCFGKTNIRKRQTQ
jgi:hypothetical protein